MAQSESSKDVVFYPKEEMLKAFLEIEFILGSLHAIERRYSVPVNEEVDTASFHQETNQFMADEQLTRRLAKVRRILTQGFDNRLGEDDMDELEQACQHIQYWKPV